MKTKAKKLNEMETNELIQTANEAINYALANIKCGVSTWNRLDELETETLRRRVKELAEIMHI